MEEDLLAIPEFLKRTPGDRDHRRAPAKRKYKMPKLDAKKPKRKPPKLDVGTRAILHGLHWTDKVIDRLSIKEANTIADAGRIMTPADEV